MVESSSWLVLKTSGFYFHPEKVMALSKLCPERLPAISWIQLKTSGDPVFKTPGRYIYRETPKYQDGLSIFVSSDYQNSPFNSGGHINRPKGDCLANDKLFITQLTQSSSLVL